MSSFDSLITYRDLRVLNEYMGGYDSSSWSKYKLGEKKSGQELTVVEFCRKNFHFIFKLDH